jgi:large conductance mechanosensitive channel
MFKGFKQFILRGNAIDLAVGVVIGAAFNSIVGSLVKGLLTPLIGAIARLPDFSGWMFSIRGSKFLIGDVINSAVSFLLTALAVYFFVVVPMNRLKKPAIPTTKICPECKSEVPISAKRCAHWTKPL